MIVALYFVSTLFAQVGCLKPHHAVLVDRANCNRHSQNAPVLDQIHELQDLIQWGATAEQVSQAACKNTRAPSAREMSESIRLRSGVQRVSETVHGVRFENESKDLVDAFRQLTTRASLYGSSYAVKEAQVDVQGIYQINPQCQQVQCAVEKIWGPSLGQKILYLKLKHGFNSSELAFDEASRFSISEIDDVLMALEDLPPSLHPLGRQNNQRMVPYTRGSSLYEEGSHVLANSGVIFFDEWRTRDSLIRQYTSFHELAHNISAKKSNADNSPEWLNLSGWRSLGEDGWEKNADACMISKYSDDTPGEDFAEVLSAYRYNALGLETRCPEKYRFMRDRIFGGIEYKTTSQCTPIDSGDIVSVHEALANHLRETQYPLSSEDVESQCQGLFKSDPPSQLELENCALSATLKVMPEESLNNFLRQAGLPVNGISKRSLETELSASSPMRAALQRQSRLVDQAVESIIGNYRTSLSQVGPPLRSSSAWSSAQGRCGFVMLEMPQEAAHCYAQALYEEDQVMSEWGAGFLPKRDPPTIFSDQAIAALRRQEREVLEAALMESLEMRSQLAEERANFKRDVLEGIKIMKSQTRLPSNWRDLSPEEFCTLSYSRSNQFFSSWGIQVQETLAPIKEECTRSQEGSHRRRHPSENDWKRWADVRWN